MSNTSSLLQATLEPHLAVHTLGPLPDMAGVAGEVGQVQVAGLGQGVLPLLQQVCTACQLIQAAQAQGCQPLPHLLGHKLEEVHLQQSRVGARLCTVRCYTTCTWCCVQLAFATVLGKLLVSAAQGAAWTTFSWAPCLGQLVVHVVALKDPLQGLQCTCWEWWVLFTAWT